MLTISINEPELQHIELIRIALSEESLEARERAIINVKHDVVATRLDVLSRKLGPNWTSDPKNSEFANWVAQSSPQRHEFIYELSQTGRRYEDKWERKLNTAEQIGKMIHLSIREKKYQGVQTIGGILEQVSDQAKELGASGARDTDTLRKIWKMYRGVVHLGMAIDFCDENPNPDMNVLQIAEQFRRCLSENAPKSRSKPYVDPDTQISFAYLSRIWGPRFQDRGLPYDIG